MAIAENGPQGKHRGRVGNVVYYNLNGQNVSRAIGRLTKPPTEKQLGHRAAMGLIPPFLKTILEFIEVGFAREAIGTTKNPYNLAMEFNFNEIIKGVYPNLEIEFTKVIVSKGKLKPAQQPVAELNEQGLQFSWQTDPQMVWSESTNQAMMLAYFPIQKRAIYTLFGSSRLSGTDSLILPEELRDQPMHTYLSFISANRQQLSDSTYLKAFNLTA